MKKTLISLGIFLVLCSIIYIVLLFLHSKYLPRVLGGNVFKYSQTYDYSLSRLHEADTTNDIDVLILGSSHAYRGYDVRLFAKRGLKALNLGTSAQTLVQTNYLVNKYIDQLKPEIVILDIYPSLLDNDGLESTLQLLSIAQPDRSLVQMALDSYDIRAYNTLLYNSINDEFDFLKKDLKDQPNKENRYVKGGFVENSTIGSLYKYKKNKLVISAEQRKSLGELVNSFKKRDIKYYLFQAPAPETKYESTTNNEAIDSTLATYGEYYNINDEYFLNDSCFMDDSHINYSGVKIYNKYVLDKVESR